VSEWLAYLEAYEAYLDELEAELARGGPGLGRFDAPHPGSAMPAAYADRAQALIARTSTLAALLKERTRVVGTVLRYSRMKDPEKVILIDVLA